MGAVYLARDTQLERRVALKIPKVSASGSKKLLQRLQTEAKAAAQLEHPGVCKVHDCGAIDGTCFISMQFVEGETLKSQLKDRGKTPAEAVSLVLQLAEALADAHEMGIIHRDLKPENVMISRRGQPVIMDFGLAKLSTATGEAARTQAGTILGSPAYMSPEQALGEASQVTGQTDIYTLGVILHEMLTGQWPFSGPGMQIMGQKATQDPLSPLIAKPDLNPRLAEICHKMIARNKDDRYKALPAVIADLKALDLGGACWHRRRPPQLFFPTFPANGCPRQERIRRKSSRCKKARPRLLPRVGCNNSRSGGTGGLLLCAGQRSAGPRLRSYC